jgi:hypothetical protein
MALRDRHSGAAKTIVSTLHREHAEHRERLLPLRQLTTLQANREAMREATLRPATRAMIRRKNRRREHARHLKCVMRG